MNQFNWIERTLILLGRFLDIVLSLMILSVFFFLFLQVLFRYVFELPLYWVEELVKFLMVYVTTIGGAAAYRRYGHPHIAILYSKIGLPGRMAYEVVLRLPIIALMAVFAVVGLDYAIDNQWMTTSGLDISFFWPFFGVPLGGAFILIVLVLDTLDIVLYRRSWLMDVNVPEIADPIDSPAAE